MEEINKVNTALAIVLIAFAVVIMAGLIVIPALQEAQAANSISDSRDKGARGDAKSDFKRQGKNCELC